MAIKNVTRKKISEFAAYNAATFVLHVLQQAPLQRERSTRILTSAISSIDGNKSVQITSLPKGVDRSPDISPVFISYSHVDREFVDKIGNYLTQSGIRYWRDIHDMTAGRIEKQIDRALHLNTTVLIILSEHSIKSDWAEHEVRTARGLEQELGRDVLCPIALDDGWKSSRWPRRLMEQIMEYNILDFSAWHDDSKFDSMFRKLIDGLELFYKG